MTVRVGSGVDARIFPDTDWTEVFELSGEAGRLGGSLTQHKHWVPALCSDPDWGMLVWLLLAVSSMAAPLQRDAPSEASSLIHRVPATVPEPGRSWPEP